MQTGQSALHFACQYGHEPVVRLLLDAQADITPRPASAGSKRPALPSALRVASKYGHEPIARLIAERQMAAHSGGFSASGAMLPLPGVTFDAATQRFYFTAAVYVD